jgi:hypothetical protein
VDGCFASPWWDDEPDIAKFVKSHNLSAEKTIRLARTDGENFDQALIVPELVSVLDARVDCYPPGDATLTGPSKPKADYGTWQKVKNPADRNK